MRERKTIGVIFWIRDFQMRFKRNIIIIFIEIMIGLYVFICYKTPACENFHIITKDEDMFEKFKVSYVSEKMWNEKFDENEVEKFEMKFKDLHVNYHFHKNYKNDCGGVKLLIMIFSRPNAFDGRMALRNSWLQNKNSSVIHRFIIGATWNSTIRNANKKEAQRYKDLIITNIRDSYLNGTLKAHAMFQWQYHYCPDIEYLLKADDDSVIDLSRLQYFLQKDFQALSDKYSKKAIFCNVIPNALPVRIKNKKWYIPKKTYDRCVFPDYCNGAFYLITSKAVKAILNEAPQHNMLYIEDVMFTGIVAEAAGIKLFQEKKHFDRGNGTKVEFLCDDNNVPYLTAIYENGNDDLIFKQGEKNKFTESLKRLRTLSCQNV